MFQPNDSHVHKYLKYLSTLENATDELSKINSMCDHMLYYFTNILGLTETESIGVVDHFNSNFVDSGLRKLCILRWYSSFMPATVLSQTG